MYNHTDLLNYLAQKFELDTYLEIGVNVKGNNFHHIVCEHKVGVDPNPRSNADCIMTSDEYFELYFQNNNPGLKWKMIFIDGLHHADQVKKDFENAIRALDDRGFIVFHDCNPAKEEWAVVPREKRGVWNGDVYRFILTLDQYDGIDFRTVDFDHGCTVLWKDKTKRGTPTLPMEEINWQYLQENKDLLRLISVEDFILLPILLE